MKFLLIGLLLLVVGGYGSAKAYLHYKVKDGVESAIIASSPYADLSYGGVSSTLTGELTVDDVVIRVNGYRDAIYIGRLGIDTPSFLTLLQLSDLSSMAPGSDSGPPEQIGFIAENIRVPVSADYFRDVYEKNIEELAPPDIRQGGVQCVGKYGHSPRALRALGYEDMITSVALTMRQEETRFVLDMGFNLVDVTDIEIEVAIAGNLMAGAMMGPAYRPTLQSLEVKLTDQSMLQRIQQYCSKLGLTPPQIERAHISALQYFGSTLGIEFDEYIIEPYKEYLAGKPSFIATARPHSPLDLASLDKYKPSDVPALLNLEAVAR